ncbi:acyl-CoA thioesterase [Flavobacteriaceae bacterium R38]|nr:acyl-CoA thioesterase [Flavobacteriaceae bacterium R38]
MSSLPKTVKTSTKVRFQDCDPFNHLNNSKYLDYFTNAREDQISENYNLDIYKYTKQTGNSWVVGSHQIAYLKPAILMEEVVIDSQLLEYSDKTIQVELRMWDKNQTQLKAVLWSTFVHFNIRSGKATSHEQKLITLFKEIKNPLEVKSFEKRIEQLKSNLKKANN